MPLTSGSRLGSYTIAARLGAGGMGEVYRATDPKLGREVAIKVLPPEVAQSPERLARFQREAQILASLNHPNVAGIYGLEEAEGKPFLVMELVEGEDLAERLKRGPIPLDEALDLARQMASGLEAAHEKGIVHRDLKPANLKVTGDGKLEILDFGLAKASGPDVARGGSSGDSPTMTAAATSAGMILGTAAYMSPEQARGKSVDKRADIWAFGAVLYEMLAGRPLFAGETVSDTLAAILTREPDLEELPAEVPPRVRALLARCLKKDPRERLRDIGDARIELSERQTPAAAAPPLSDRRSLAWVAVGVLAAVVAALTGGVLVGRRSAVTEPPTFRPLTFARGFVHSARFAPDGQTVVYGGAFEGRPLALFSTRTDGHDSRPIDVPSADVAGIAGDGTMALLLGRHHAGTWLRLGTLAQVSLAGGTPREILADVFDADISPDGEQFAVVVEENGRQVLQYPVGKTLHRSQGWISQPRIAPDGKRVAFVDHAVYGDDLGIPKLVGTDGKVVDLGPEEQFCHGLCWSPDGEEVWFSSGSPVRGGELWKARPGQPRQLVLRAFAIFRVQDVARDGHLLLLADDSRVTVAGQLAGDTADRVYSWWDNDLPAAISADGTSYTGDNGSVEVDGEYVVFFRRGSEPPVQVGTGVAAGMTPDGKYVFTGGLTKNRTRLVVRPVGPGQTRDISLGDISPAGGNAQRLSCSSDGKRLAFAGNRPGSGTVAIVVEVDGGAPRVVSPQGVQSALISPDGSKVAVSDTARGLYVVPAAGGGGEPVPIPGIPKDHIGLAWTPDGGAVLTWDRTLPPRIFRTPVAGGTPELVREIALPDPAGIIYGGLTLSPGGAYHLLRYRRVMSNVALVEGVATD